MTIPKILMHSNIRALLLSLIKKLGTVYFLYILLIHIPYHLPDIRYFMALTYLQSIYQFISTLGPNKRARGEGIHYMRTPRVTCHQLEICYTRLKQTVHHLKNNIKVTWNFLQWSFYVTYHTMSHYPVYACYNVAIIQVWYSSIVTRNKNVWNTWGNNTSAPFQRLD